MASMSSKRYRHTTLTLADGTLLAFGGSSFPEGSERLVPLLPPVPQNPAPLRAADPDAHAHAPRHGWSQASSASPSRSRTA